jgi:hypothetical protein
MERYPAPSFIRGTMSMRLRPSVRRVPLILNLDAAPRAVFAVLITRPLDSNPASSTCRLIASPE